MAPGDVLLTPNWSTHGHGNRSKACAYWLDFLDVPLVQLLEPMFFEAAEDDGNVADDSGRAPAEAATDQPFVFTLADTLRRLGEAKPDPGGPFGTQIELGHPALATTALYMMRLAPGVRTAPYRITANNIFAVWCRAKAHPRSTASGSNGGAAMSSRPPPWRPHWHEATGDAVLLRVTDEPVMQRFGWWREELAAQ